MSKSIIATITILIMVFIAPVYAQAGGMSVTVNQIDVEKGGKVNIGIYDEKGFPVIGKGVKEVALEVKETTVVYVFEKIPAGKYAIAVFQDVNSDGKLNKNMLGAPQEPYGFSKNLYGMFGPPSFADVSFDVVEDKITSWAINLE
jgi:uncharacterized protein (DUF2141 family)